MVVFSSHCPSGPIVIAVMLHQYFLAQCTHLALSADVACALICLGDESVFLSWLIPENRVLWCHSLFNVLRELGATMMMSPDPCFPSEIPKQSPQQGGMGWVFILSDTTEVVVSLLSSEKREELDTSCLGWLLLRLWG